MMKETGGPQDTVARDTLNTVSKQVTKIRPQPSSPKPKA